jgi:FlaA1/EpsC-like NDP-sugar epimerase
MPDRRASWHRFLAKALALAWLRRAARAVHTPRGLGLAGVSLRVQDAFDSTAPADSGLGLPAAAAAAGHAPGLARRSFRDSAFSEGTRVNLARLGQRMAGLSGPGKLALILAADGLFLPLCAFVAVALSPATLAGATRISAWGYLAAGLCTVAVLAATGLYRSVVRFIDLRTMATTTIGLAGVVLMLYIVVKANDLDKVPHSSILTYWFLAFAYLLTSRVVARAVLQSGMKKPGRPRRRTLIYGAGSAGVELANAMALSLDYQAVCFVDDSPALRRRVVAGLTVYGPHELEAVTQRLEVEQIVVAVPSAAASERRALIGRMEAIGLPVKMLPGLSELVEAGHPTVADIRDIDVSDLLGRDAVPPNPALFSRNIRGKVVMVTGAAGSIGSELCRQILTQGPTRLVLLDHSEFGLYTIENDLQQLRGNARLVPVLGTVIDGDLVERVMREHGVQTVYHAAAYKHVPMVEANVRQGVLNNVFGTLAVAVAAARCKLETCVLVSTDKAVRPTNVMGASKRISELIFQASAVLEESSTVFSMVRFGNVLGSSGSVVPLFKRQIEGGGPITITHPDIIRYFMLIPEAAQLVIQAGAMAKGGEVYVLDMGEPVRIADLARTMLRLYGLTEKTPEQPNGDIELKFVGLRPGEKLYEELLIGDKTVPSIHPRIMCAMERSIEPMLLEKMLSALRKACDAGDEAAVLRQVRNLVPEFRDPDEVNKAAQVQAANGGGMGQAGHSAKPAVPAFMASGT